MDQGGTQLVDARDLEDFLLDYVNMRVLPKDLQKLVGYFVYDEMVSE